MRYRGYWIERVGWRGDYHVYANIRGPGVRNRDLVFVRESKWGLKQTKLDIDAIFETAERAERERQRHEDARRRRLAEEAERERLWLSRLPSTSCRRCGARHVEALYNGGRIPLDIEPDEEGDWVVFACQVAGRVPMVRRAEPDEQIADRYEIHHATCTGRPPMADPTGQYRLRLGRHAARHDRPARHRKPARQLTLRAAPEQLEIPTC